MEKVNQLETLVPHYAQVKAEADSYKKEADKDNAEIKDIMLSSKLDKYEAGGYVASCTVATKETLNEDALLTFLKKRKMKALIKKREYVDMDALEAAIYNGTINAAELAPFQDTKDVVTLRIKKA